jgi:tmRNA-binding protein
MKKKKSVAELAAANKTCFSVNEERKRKLIIANKELFFQDTEKKTSSRTNHNAELFFKMKKKKPRFGIDYCQ